MTKLIYCFLFSVVSHASMAQDTLANPSAYKLPSIKLDTVPQTSLLDPITITSLFNQLSSSTTGRNIQVISGELFNRLPVHSLDDLLRYIPGLEVQSRGPMGAQADISIRGGTFQQVLVLIDGLRVNDANTGHFSAYMPIAPTEIARVEVLKGASSAIYGSDAVGGVVHIITKTFAKQNAVAPLQLSAKVAVGEYGLANTNAGGMWQKDRTTLSGGYLGNSTRGRLQRGGRGFVNNQTYSLSAQHQLASGWMLSVRGASDVRRFAAQNFYTLSAADTAQETVQTSWTQAQAVKQGIRSTFRIAAGYKWLRDSFSFNRSVASNQNRSRLAQLLITQEQQLSATTTIVVGAQAVQRSIRSNDRGNHSVGQAAAFVVLHQEVDSNLSIAPALRAEWNSRAGWEAVPQLNVSYHIRSWQLRASGGKTIRDADFTERFNNYGKTIVAGGQRLGNPDLVAERSWSYEAGADWLWTKNLKLSGTFFQRFQRELIDYTLTPYAGINRKENLLPNAVYAYARNVARVATTGAELDLQWYQSFGGYRRLMLTLGNTWLRSRSSDTLPSFYLASHARFLTNFTARYSGKLGNISANGLYKARQPQRSTLPAPVNVSADYFVLNLKAELAVGQIGGWLFVQVDNVFDRRYADLLGAVMPGRWFSAGLRLGYN